jgi:hypothetical protein
MLAKLHFYVTRRSAEVDFRGQPRGDQPETLLLQRQLEVMSDKNMWNSVFMQPKRVIEV